MDASRLGSIAKQAGDRTKIEVSEYKRYNGKVVDVEDKDKRGKVKVWIPELMDKNVKETDGIWTKPGNIIFTGNQEKDTTGGDDCGGSMVPPKGAYVQVHFQNGDFNRPIYETGFTPDDLDEVVPVEHQAGKEYWNKWTILKSPQGRQIMISDDPDDCSVIIRGKYQDRGKRKAKEDPREPYDSMRIQMWEKEGEEKMLVTDGEDQYICIDKKNEKVRIQHKTGSFIEFTKEGDIKIETSRHLLINCEGAKKEDQK